MKKIYIILALLTTLSPLPLLAAEDGDDGSVEAEMSAVQLSVSGSQVRVGGAAGQTLEIYDLAGMRVAAVKIDTDDKTLQLHLQRGCYFIKIGKLVRKIAIR